MKSSRGAIVLWMGLVFACGAVLGILGYRLYTVSTVRANVGGQRSAEEFRKRYTETLKTRLHASDEQIAKIEAIMDQTRDRVRAARKVIDPEVKTIREDEQTQIRALLSPEQASAWDAWRQERADQRKKRGERSKRIVDQ